MAYNTAGNESSDSDVVTVTQPSRDGLAGVNAQGLIWYTTDLAHWLQVPSAVTSLVVGDFNGDGKADLAAVNAWGGIYYSTDLVHWTQVPGLLTSLVVGDF